MGPIIAFFGGLATLLGTLFGGVATIRSSRATGEKTAVETMQIVLDEVRTELTTTRKELGNAKKRIGALETAAIAERSHSTEQDGAIANLQNELARALAHIREVWEWIDGGSKPPPPTRPSWLTNSD